MARRNHRWKSWGLLMLSIGGTTIAGAQSPGTPAYPAAHPGYATNSPAPAQNSPQRFRMRDLFAATLATVVQSSGVALASSLSQGMNGAITQWLGRKSTTRSAEFAYPSATGATAPMPAPYPNYESAPDSSAAPQPGMPGGAPDTYPGANGYPGQDSYPGTDSYPMPGAAGGAADIGFPNNGDVYAGIAYEIHTLSPGGVSQRIDPQNHTFRGGERFMVHYRPSLPGLIRVFNTDGRGRTTQIDSTQSGGGGLESLGPYEFADEPGNEVLILELQPCANSALMTATRSIVKVGSAGMPNAEYPNAPNAVPTPASLNLGNCGRPATRGLKTKTRSIRKVDVEDGTSFALDAVAPAEMASGSLAARQVTITLVHR